MKRSRVYHVKEICTIALRFSRDCRAFLPLLFFYVFLIIILSQNLFVGDEARYVGFADNLINGFYSPSDPYEVNLWNGPGYPLVLTPFALLKLPWIAAKLANACFLFGAIIFFYRTLRLYITSRQAKIFALLLGVYPPFMSYLHYLLTEPFTIFLVSAFSFFFCHHGISKKRISFSLFAAGIVLAWLALTKIIFGYVLLCVVILGSLHYIFHRSYSSRNALAISCLALLLCCPYLIYTYSLTDKVFYWGNSGGMSLYWMSSPHPYEFGDWKSAADVSKTDELKRNHGDFFKTIQELPPIQKDSAFKAQAVRNIFGHPQKYLLNVAANIGRMLFSYPYSYAYERLSTFFRLLPNIFICVIGVLCLYPSWVARRHIPPEIIMLFLFGLIAFVGSSLVSACARQFYVLVPIWGIWIGFIVFKVLHIQFRNGPIYQREEAT